MGDNDLREAIDTAEMLEDEAHAFAERVVREVRNGRPDPALGLPAPSSAEVKAHLKAGRAARAQQRSDG